MTDVRDGRTRKLYVRHGNSSIPVKILSKVVSRLIFVVIKLIYNIGIKLKTNHNLCQYLQKWYIFVTDVQFSKILKT